MYIFFFDHSARPPQKILWPPARCGINAPDTSKSYERSNVLQTQHSYWLWADVDCVLLGGVGLADGGRGFGNVERVVVGILLLNGLK